MMNASSLLNNPLRNEGAGEVMQISIEEIIPLRFVQIISAGNFDVGRDRSFFVCRLKETFFLKEKKNYKSIVQIHRSAD